MVCCIAIGLQQHLTLVEGACSRNKWKNNGHGHLGGKNETARAHDYNFGKPNWAQMASDAFNPCRPNLPEEHSFRINLNFTLLI